MALVLKVAIVGPSNSGKTALTQRFVKDEFESKHQPTLGAQYAQKHIHHEDTKLTLHIWDTAGQERFRSLIPMYYRGAQAVVIVYDLSDEQSFKEVHIWKRKIEENINAEPDEYSIWLIANKSDLMEIDYSSNLFAQKFRNRSYISTGVELLCFGYCRKINVDLPPELIHLCHEYCGDICEGEIYALENNMNFAYCSAKNGTNVQKTFREIAIEAYEQKTKPPPIVYKPDSNTYYEYCSCK